MISMPSNGRRGICPVCEVEADLTTDHVVPDWFLKVISHFGISWKDIVADKGLRGNMFVDICGPCNRAKGGLIDYRDPTLRLFVKEFMSRLQQQLDVYDGPRKIPVICGCGRKEPCTVVPGVVAPTFTKPIELHSERCPGGKNCWCKPKRHQTKNCWCGHTEVTLVQVGV